MTEKQCYRCYYYNESHERNTLGIIGYLIKEWCDISEAHNKFLMSDKKCPYFKDDFKGDFE